MNNMEWENSMSRGRLIAAKSGKRKQITEGDIQAALRRFQAAGGLIKRLPDQGTPRNNGVGHTYGLYESMFDGLAVLEEGSLMSASDDSATPPPVN